MSKMACKCGHVIADNTNNLPYRGDILKDEDAEVFWGAIATELAGFVEAILAGKRQEWIDANFLPDYPRDLDNEAVISDILSRFEIQFLVSIYECKGCGRVLIQESTQANRFVSFAPDDGKHHQILTSEHRNCNEKDA